jgi:hypothetical protein
MAVLQWIFGVILPGISIVLAGYAIFDTRNHSKDTRKNSEVSQNAHTKIQELVNELKGLLSYQTKLIKGMSATKLIPSMEKKHRRVYTPEEIEIAGDTIAEVQSAITDISSGSPLWYISEPIDTEENGDTAKYEPDDY